MNRRDSFKTLLVGTLAGASISTSACKPEETKENVSDIDGVYGRTPFEKERDKKILSDQFFEKHELETIAILCDIILPATSTAGSAVEAGVPAFIEFISKDLPDHQIPLRGGLMWLDIESNKRYNKVFSICSEDEQIQIIEDIAYPDQEGKKPEMAQGIHFFKRLRNLVLTGYYTTKMGFDDLGYLGNRPNIWDGVPEDVLENQEVSYDPDWLAKCVDQEKRHIAAKWDDDGNLIT